MAVKRANAGVKKHCLRDCISTAWKEEGGDLGLFVPERFLAAEEAWDHWLTWDADRKLVVQKLEQCSDDFMASSKARTGGATRRMTSCLSGRCTRQEAHWRVQRGKSGRCGVGGLHPSAARASDANCQT